MQTTLMTRELLEWSAERASWCGSRLKSALMDPLPPSTAIGDKDATACQLVDGG